MLSLDMISSTREPFEFSAGFLIYASPATVPVLLLSVVVGDC